MAGEDLVELQETDHTNQADSAANEPVNKKDSSKQNGVETKSDDGKSAKQGIVADGVEDFEEEKAEGAEEQQPLKSKEEGAEDGDPEGDGPFRSANYLHEKKLRQRKCMFLGAGLLTLLMFAAVAAILVRHFTAKYYTFSLASYYGDNMVLQRAPQHAVVWGYGPVEGSNHKVEATLSSANMTKTYSATVVGTVTGATWKIVFDPISDPGPFEITFVLVDHRTQELNLKNVLFGDVWLCAGADNMQFSVNMMGNVSEDTDKPEEFPNIRLFSTHPAKAASPWYDLHKFQLPWSLPSQETLSGTYVAANQFSSHFSAVCWTFGKALYKSRRHPIGLISSTYSDSQIEEWVSPDVIAQCLKEVPDHRYNGVATSSLWNAMIYPLLSSSIFGVVWYQGEKDATDFSRSYNCTFPRMIEDWTQKFQQNRMGSSSNMSFGFVQLAPNRASENLLYGWTDTRWQQTADFGFVPNRVQPDSFMAVTMDLPDTESPYGSMHPRYKEDIGERLALAAQFVAYNNVSAPHEGPSPIAYTVNTAQQSLHLEYSPAPIELRSSRGFEICCSDEPDLYCFTSNKQSIFAPGREWKDAKITESDDTSLTLSWFECGSGRHVVGLRYAWRESPCDLHECAVYGKATRLPAAPYFHFGFKADAARQELPKTPHHIT